MIHPSSDLSFSEIADYCCKRLPQEIMIRVLPDYSLTKESILIGFSYIKDEQIFDAVRHIARFDKEKLDLFCREIECDYRAQSR